MDRASTVYPPTALHYQGDEGDVIFSHSGKKPTRAQQRSTVQLHACSLGIELPPTSFYCVATKDLLTFCCAASRVDLSFAQQQLSNAKRMP
jgi:hypothetical protein